jgi:hypothetical protein
MMNNLVVASFFCNLALGVIEFRDWIIAVIFYLLLLGPVFFAIIIIFGYFFHWKWIRTSDYDTGIDNIFKWLARLTGFGAIIVFILSYIFIYPPLIIYALFALAIPIIAWFFPIAGGILILLLSTIGIVPLVQVGWAFSWKWPIYILLTIFVISGISNLIYGCRTRKFRTA